MKAERLELFGDKKSAYTAARVNPTTWKRVEDGEPVRDDRLVKVFKALGWTVAEGWAIFSGAEPPNALPGLLAQAEPGNPVREAILEDPLLDDRGRENVLAVYDREVEREAEIRHRVGT